VNKKDQAKHVKLLKNAKLERKREEAKINTEKEKRKTNFKIVIDGTMG